MIATTTVNSPPSSQSSLGHESVVPSTAPVLRVSREVENIGERVPLSKKRITWRFVFADSAQVHTVTLEHSRISAKKRLRLDGRRLHTSEQYCAGDWRYEFHVAKTHAARFCVIIRDVKSTVVEERSLDSIYQLSVDGRAWDQLDDRALPRPRSGSSVWSSELYARRVSREERVMERSGDEDNNKAVTAHCVAWTFAFGLYGTIHKLELRDLDRGDDEAGEFIVILDSRLLARVNHDDIHEDVWEYEYKLFNQHMLTAVVTLEGDGKKYEFFIAGCAWKDLSETDFVLQPDWFPVYSRTRGTSYFRNQKTAVSQWERPIMSRNGEAIEVPRRLSTQSVPVPTDHFDSDGLVRLSTGQDNQAVEHMAPSLAPLTTFHEVAAHQNQKTTKNDDINLIDFSEMAIRVSPTSSHEKESFTSFDPFAHIAVQQQFQAQRRASNQPPVDLLS